MKKLLAIGIIVLFLCLAFAPSINANKSKESVDYEKAGIRTKKKDIPFPPPIIEQPKPGHIYFFDCSRLYLYAFEVLNISGTIGKITIEVSHPDSDNVSRIEFYINNWKRWVDRSPPYRWTWRFSLMPVNVVKVVAVSHTGETASTEIVVFRLLLASLYSTIYKID